MRASGERPATRLTPSGPPPSPSPPPDSVESLAHPSLGSTSLLLMHRINCVQIKSWNIEEKKESIQHLRGLTTSTWREEGTKETVCVNYLPVLLDVLTVLKNNGHL
ncbi:uncharacterized protein [Triticum aestivum]|uniref:uncharacterized protein n=1 Tax=Triticum aestivum TaxID=4565 RepID=UPI001D01731C|nr:uncharacterized protein LOC123149220 [Triticum aestivum]